MQIEGPPSQPIREEFDVLSELVPLDGARILELGCGAAEKTRQIAETFPRCQIVASEVDQIQQGENLLIDDLPNVSFQSFGAENIDAADQSFDAVLMFKSLHHVPVEAMDAALDEIVRVLKPKGLAYISEPVFAGAFNEIVRLFHDESEVRKAAFAALRRCVTANKLALAGQHFFYNRLRLKSFAQFEQGVVNVTHTDHQLSAELFEEVRARFEDHASDQGYRFEIPNRVDLLRKAPL